MNEISEWGYTALMLAACGHKECLEILISAGGNINHLDLVTMLSVSVFSVSSGWCFHPNISRCEGWVCGLLGSPN